MCRVPSVSARLPVCDIVEEKPVRTNRNIIKINIYVPGENRVLVFCIHLYRYAIFFSFSSLRFGGIHCTHAAAAAHSSLWGCYGRLLLGSIAAISSCQPQNILRIPMWPMLLFFSFFSCRFAPGPNTAMTKYVYSEEQVNMRREMLRQTIFHMKNVIIM